MLKENPIEKLNNLSDTDLSRLAKLMFVGVSEDLDRDELILVLSTEPIEKIEKGLKQLNK